MLDQQTVQSKGIFHGLPVFPSSTKGLTAIITGANGISGNYMLQVLSEAPERWTKIYCLSRRPPAIPDGLPPQAEHIALDFLKEPDEISRVLKEKDVKADYIFFYSYVQAKPKEGGGLWSDAEEMCRVNSKSASTSRHLRTSGVPVYCFCDKGHYWLTHFSCVTSQFLRGTPTCVHSAKTYHAADRCEKLRGSSRTFCYATRRDCASRYLRA